MSTQIKPNFIDEMVKHFGSLAEAIRFFESDRARHPVEAGLNLQVLLNAVGREEESFVVSTQMQTHSPNDSRVLFNRGWHLIKRDRYPEGFRLLEHGRLLNTYGHPPLPSNQPLWSPDRPRGETVILSLEGGLGDEIINVRFARTLHERYGARVVLSCHPSLASIFARLPGVGAVAQREATPGIFHQSWLPGMSAVAAMGLTSREIGGSPYLETAPAFREKWRQRLASPDARPKVGLRWAGNPKFEHQQLRKFPAETLLELAGLDHLRFFSFQRDNDLTRLPDGVTDLAPELKDWEDTAAALAEMDLVISSCTSVAHMAAALGKPTWVLVPVLGYYIWALPGDDSPWYDSVRLFRQETFGDWTHVGSRVRGALLEKFPR